MTLWQIVHPFSRQTDPPSTEERPAETTRETADQLLYSFVLLILGKAFLMEPFVIPTGSMAPTLYGRHKECQCEACDFEYQIGASCEVPEGGSKLITGTRILLSTCPNCQHPNDVKDSLAFNGDHVLVNKWSFILAEPQRWDVFVFKYPSNPAKNFIKRLVGQPNERIRIRQGDVYRVGQRNEAILRMDQPRKRRAACILVHDNAYDCPPLEQAGWPRRWAGQGWEDAGSSLTLKAATGQTAWLTYTHYMPSPRDWEDALAGRPLSPRPRLVTDYCPYNSYTGPGYANPSQRSAPTPAERIDAGIFWVPDLAVECEADLGDASEGATLTAELVDGVYRYRCRIDLNTGRAELLSVNTQLDPNEERPMASADTSVRGGGRYRLRFSNIDDRLTLWVDDAVVDFGEGARYLRDRSDNSLPTRADLSPVRIGVAGAAATVGRLKLFRDLYYRAEGRPMNSPDVARYRETLISQQTDPDAYARTMADADPAFRVQDLQTGEGEYIALGDNSPQSNDSRAWDEDNRVVPANHLVGKAFWTYWPHGVPFLNNGRGIPVRYHYAQLQDPETGRMSWQKLTDYPRYSVPFYPNVRRMTRIR